MKNKAFTLIEVLVVILIVGVLGSIAFAQYQKSVLKSRFSTLVPIAKALNDGQEMFLLSHGKYADRLENLDVEIAANASGSTATINGNIITLGANKRHTYIKVTKENFDNNLIMFQQESRYFPGEIHCEAKTGKILANWLCKVALKGKEVSGANDGRSLTEGYTDYVINGAENGFFPKDWVNPTKEDKDSFKPGDTCTGTEESYQCRELNFNNGACYAESGYNCGNGAFVSSTCTSTAGQSCSGSFTDSSCIANGSESCMGSSYLNSTCEANKSYGCYHSNFKNSSCTGNSRSGACQNSTFDNSECIADGTDIYNIACYTSTYKNKSSCIANGKGCYDSTFENSTCTGNAASSCGESTFTETSVCNGNNSAACQGSTFKDNSICYANEDGACGDSKNNDGTVKTPAVYEGNACCKGTLCPANVPKCDCGIDSNTGQHALSC